ncbi:MAG: alkaline phosphatase family protein [Erysipelotrichaceae bacterium]|nr:alkaline phosphatase family protein [Erysipelotrichaceae bacterium]
MTAKNRDRTCITNFACSIRRYFGLELPHASLEEADRLLDELQPENVVTILCDGLGSVLLKKMLPEDAFLRTRQISTLSSVFPPTTVAAETALATGRYPVETGMLGWTMYYKDLDDNFTVFLNTRASDPESGPLQEAAAWRQEHLKEKSIVDEINEQKKGQGYFLIPFQPDPYRDFDQMLERIEFLCAQKGRKYIFAYDLQPDEILHEKGCDAKEAKETVLERNDKIEALCSRLKNTLVFVTADHGHINVKNIDLSQYPDLTDCLVRNPSLEPRAACFFVREEKKREFESLFEKYFSDDFDLYSREEVIESGLFGDGAENEIFREALGDFLAVAGTDKALIAKGGSHCRSHHGGLTEDEMLVPLTALDCCTSRKK